MKFLHWSDLEERGYFRSKMTLKRAISDLGFPPGILITGNRRAYPEQEVLDWIASRPVAPKKSTRRGLEGAADRQQPQR